MSEGRLVGSAERSPSRSAIRIPRILHTTLRGPEIAGPGDLDVAGPTASSLVPLAGTTLPLRTLSRRVVFAIIEGISMVGVVDVAQSPPRGIPEAAFARTNVTWSVRNIILSRIILKHKWVHFRNGLLQSWSF